MPRAALAGLALALALPAQVPPGWAAVSSFQSATSAPGGLAMAHSALAGPSVPITGLPAALTGPGPGGQIQGAGSVLVDPATGDLIVGEHTPTGQSNDIHVLSLSGAAVTSDRVYPLGTVARSIGSVDQMAWLGDDIVFAVRGNTLAGGPFANQSLGIFRPRLGPPGTPGVLAPIPLTFDPPGTVNALAVDENAGLAWFAKLRSGSGQTDLYSVPVPGTGVPAPPRLVLTIQGVGLSLAVQHDGKVLLAGFRGPLALLALVDPTASPVLWSALPTGSLSSLNAILREDPTGDLLVCDDGNGTLARLAGGSSRNLAAVGGVLSGVARRPALRPYGLATPRANRYDWQISPHPGGLPLVGNRAFSLTLASLPGTAPGLLGLAPAPAAVPLPGPGVTLLLDPATLVIAGALPAQSPASLALPLPALPALAGTEWFAQSAHFEPGGAATSRGLRISLF